MHYTGSCKVSIPGGEHCRSGTKSILVNDFYRGSGTCSIVKVARRCFVHALLS